MSAKTCPESGTALNYSNQYRDGIPEGVKGYTYFDNQDKRHAICAHCGKDVKITSAGFGGARGSIPRHNKI